MNKKINNFLKYRKYALFISNSCIVVSLFFFVFSGINFGLEFTGGVLIEVSYNKSVDLSNIRKKLMLSGFDNIIVQYFGEEKDVLIRLKSFNGSFLGDKIINIISFDDNRLIVRRNEFIGPHIGNELRNQGIIAIFLGLCSVILYVTFRFHFRYAIGAVIALIHDVIITLGIFSFFQLEFNLNILAAILVIIGYSLNDSMIISDRIRENFYLMHRSSLMYVINVSLNQIINRTLITSLTTLLVLFVLFFYGGDAIYGFSLALLIGIITGTYSSIYILTNVLIAYNIRISYVL